MTRSSVAIEALYETFVSYPLRGRIEGCPCCVSDGAESRLHSLALRQLTWDDLGFFLFKAMTTFGEVDDFKHFLPRIFELFVVDCEGCPYDAWLLPSKLAYGEFAGWPEEEQAAVRAGLMEVRAVLRSRADVDPELSDELDEFEAELSRQLAAR